MSNFSKLLPTGTPLGSSKVIMIFLMELLWSQAKVTMTRSKEDCDMCSGVTIGKVTERSMLYSSMILTTKTFV